MKTKTENKSFIRAWKLNMRALKLLHGEMPGWFTATILNGLLTAAAPYAAIWFSARLIAELCGGRDVNVLTRYVILILASSALLMLLKAIVLRWANAEDSMTYDRMRNVFIKKMLGMDFVDIDSQHVFDLKSQIDQNEGYSDLGMPRAFEAFQVFVESGFKIMGGVVLTVSLFASKIPDDSKGIMFLNSPIAAAIMLALLIGAAVAAPACYNRADRFWSDYAPRATLGNRIFSFFGFTARKPQRAEDMRMYDQQQNVCGKYLGRSNTFGVRSSLARDAKGKMGAFYTLSACIAVLLNGAVYLFVCLKAYGGAFGLGEVTQYIGAITALFGGLNQLVEQMGQVQVNARFVELIRKLLDTPNGMYKGSLTTEKRSDRKYSVEFRNVSFKYPGSDAYALKNMNIKFRVGSRLAVVGMNGSGKTTFIKLLCRLYDPTEGEILLNGIDIRKYRYDEYMDIFSVVFQDFKLFALPLGQNVATSSTYDEKRVTDCLIKAGFGERLKTLEKGLDTYLYKQLDKDGVEMSGGEEQKIAIARALYKDAPFIVLDEPTAALDPVAEAEIYEKFNDIAGDKTAIYISHRLSSCKFCDEIAVFDGGRMIQFGTHEELLADEGGKYHELWYAQAQYYAEQKKRAAEMEQMV